MTTQILLDKYIEHIKQFPEDAAYSCVGLCGCSETFKVMYYADNYSLKLINLATKFLQETTSKYKDLFNCKHSNSNTYLFGRTHNGLKNKNYNNKTGNTIRIEFLNWLISNNINIFNL